MPVGSRLLQRWLWLGLFTGAPLAGAQALVIERETVQRRFDHSNAVWNARFWRDSPSEGEDVLFFLDRAQFNRNRQAEGRSQQQNLNWTLGLGKQSDHFAQLSADSVWQRRIADHQLTLTLGLNASLFKGSAAFQDLEAQYLLAPVDGTTAATPGEAIERSQEWGIDFDLADTYRATPTLDLLFSTQARRNDYRLDTRRKDVTELVGVGAGFSKRWSRISWDTNGQAYQLSFNDLLSDDPGGRTRRQDLESLNSFISSAVSPRFRLGLGYQVLRTSFTDGERRQVEGPGLTLARSPDGRLGWEAQFSLLREQGALDTQGQGYGALSLNYLISPRSNLVLSVSKEVDLLRYYTSYTAENLLFDTEQQYTIQSSLAWNFQTGRSRWSLLVVKDEQRFIGAKVDNLSTTATSSYRLNRASDIQQRLELRRNREDATELGLNLQETVLGARSDGERQALIWTSSYRQRWASGSARIQPYFSIDLSYELLKLLQTGENLHRATITLGLGQELQI